MKLQVVLSVLFLFVNRNCKNPASENAQTTVDQSAKVQSAVTKNDTSNKAVHFGIMVAKTEGKLIPPQQQIQVAKALNVDYIRCRIDIQGWNGSSDAYNTYASAGLKILLNINYGVPRNVAGEHDAVPFPTDMDAYTKSLNSILDKYKPEV